MTDAAPIKTLPVSQLNFDRNNPRLAEYGVSEATSDKEIIKLLWDAMDVGEIVLSIVASGFFEHESMIVAKEKNGYTVIEGNRRLAAVKVLLDEALAKENNWDVPVISADAKSKLSELPVMESDREGAWRYIGFKHVNGPAKWTSYAKACYVADVHRKYKISLSDIASQIGDKHHTVQRIYRGLMLIEQAEREKVYDRENRFRPHFSFSHLYTGMNYDGISAFLGPYSNDEESQDPVPKENLKKLGELCEWLFGNKTEKKPPIIET